jgi:hypothetical protein
MGSVPRTIFQSIVKIAGLHTQGLPCTDQIAERSESMEGEDNMKTGLLRGGVLIASTLFLAACGQREVSYKADVQPIVKQHCLECHAEGGKGTEKSGLLMTSHESLMKGTKFGSIIKPGDSLSSVMIMLVEGRADPSIKMPHGKESIPKEKIDVLKKWVEQGAKNN